MPYSSANSCFGSHPRLSHSTGSDFQVGNNSWLYLHILQCMFELLDEIGVRLSVVPASFFDGCSQFVFRTPFKYAYCRIWCMLLSTLSVCITAIPSSSVSVDLTQITPNNKVCAKNNPHQQGRLH